MTEGGDGDFEAVLEHLKEQRGFDFTGYKRASLQRRFQRRMGTLGAKTYEEYLDYLQVHPDEFTALFNTILINVTGFFRDADAWEELSQQVVPGIVESAAGGPIRVWSAGCASGEEAYSLAMAFADAMGADEFRQQVKIYATDVDEEALAIARQASYQERELRGLDAEHIERFFEPNSTVRTFRKDLRRAVIFGRNDLVQDAPISRVDLLVCRNTLMYFNAETQAQILNRLHFALRPEGVLFLGKAEMLLSHGSLFAPIDLKRRFFRKVLVQPPRERRPPAGEPNNNSSDASSTDIEQLTEEALLSSPVPQVVLGADNTLAMSNHRADALFGLSSRDVGRPFQDLELSYRPVEIRGYLDEAVRTRRVVWVRGVEWHRIGGDLQAYDIQVVPLHDETGNPLGTTVMFNDVTRYRQLQGELEYANRQLETAYEELQSTNEELETMNEELQSMNDELHATNEELRARTTEVDELNTFMGSVLASMRTGVAVVDNDLRILAWNERAEDLWGVRQDEAVGQHLLNLDIGLPMEEVRPLLRKQLADGSETLTAQMPAVNRRGRPVQVRVTVSPLAATPGREEHPGAILVMDQVDE